MKSFTLTPLISNLYHDFVLDAMNHANRTANGNVGVFLEQYNNLVIKPVLDNPALLRKAGWN